MEQCERLSLSNNLRVQSRNEGGQHHLKDSVRKSWLLHEKDAGKLCRKLINTSCAVHHKTIFCKRKAQRFQTRGNPFANDRVDRHTKNLKKLILIQSPVGEIFAGVKNEVDSKDSIYESSSIADMFSYAPVKEE